MADFESDFKELCDKFKNHKGLVTATDVNRKNIGRTETSQYRRDLLNRAIEERLAWSNGKNSTHNKYGIYFNVAEDSKQTKEYFFDSAVLLHPMIINMPSREHPIHHLFTYRHALWVQVKEEWTEVYRALCVYQDRGGITAKDLHFRAGKDTTRYYLIKINMYIAMYRAIKVGWDDPTLKEAGVEISDYNSFFVFILHSNSNEDFFRTISPSKETIQYNSTHANLLELRTHERERKYLPTHYEGEDLKFERDGLEKALNSLEKQVAGTLRLTPSLSYILCCLEQSVNPHVQKAAMKWREADAELTKITISLYRPLKEDSSDKRRVFLDEIRRLP